MGENVILLVNFENMCRLCLQSVGGMTNIYEPNENSLKDLIILATGLNIKENDELPSKICYKCRYVVEQACELREMCTQTDKLLMEAIRSNNSSPHSDYERDDEEIYSDLQDKNELSQFTDGVKKRKYKSIKRLTNDSDVKKSPNNKAVPKTSKVPNYLTCLVCLMTFKTTKQVRAHVDTHYEDSSLTPYLDMKRPYTCEICNDGVLRKKQLLQHHREHLKVNPYVCRHPGCTYIGKELNKFRHHQIRHGVRSFACESCDAAFIRRSELYQHTVRCHMPPSVWRCRLCHKLFRSELAYRTHLETHERPKYMPCSWPGCGKTFGTRIALKTHQRLHSDDRRYKCYLCNAASYTSQKVLNRHLQMHERNRLTKCDKCNRTFSDYNAFYRHRTSAHEQWLPHRCIACSRGHDTEAQLEEHKKECKLALSMKACEEMFETNVKKEKRNSETMEIDSEGLHRERKSISSQPAEDADKDGTDEELPADELVYIEVVPGSDEEESTSK